MSSQEMILKANELTTSLMSSGGYLNPKQQDRYIELVRSYGVLLPRARVVKMTQAVQDFDKLHLGEPITRAGAEAQTNPNVANSSGAYASVAYGASPDYPYKSVPKFNKVTLSAVKTRADWAISIESLQNNIAGNSLEGSFMSMVTERLAQDMEEMAINGDTSTSLFSAATVDSPYFQLRRILNGWDVQTNDAIILDVGGSYISKQVWNDMIRIQPKDYKNDPGVMFMASDNVCQDWQELLSERATGIGDEALKGMGIAPFGKPLLRVPTIRDDKAISTSPAYAKVVSGHYGPFVIPANARIEVAIDGATTADNQPGVIALPAGTWDTNQIVALLTPNDGFGGSATRSKGVYIGTTEYYSSFLDTGDAASNATSTALALDVNFRAAEVGDGRFVIYSNATSSQQVTVRALTTNIGAVYTNVANILGLADSSNTSYLTQQNPTTNNEGSFIWLANPKNFMWGILDGTRIFTEYNKDNDTIETTLHNFVAAAVENTRAVVKAVNVRAKTGQPA